MLLAVERPRLKMADIGGDGRGRRQRGSESEGAEPDGREGGESSERGEESREGVASTNRLAREVRERERGFALVWVLTL